MAVTEGQLISDGTAVWKVKKIGNGELPAGTTQMFAGNTIPEGWLLCDGSAISRTDYAKLFSAIGTIYGAGDGSTTFALPDLMDRVVQGAVTAGTYKEAGLPNITGRLSAMNDNCPLWTLTGANDLLKAEKAFSFESTQKGSEIDNVPIYRNNANNSGAILLNASKSNSIYGNSTTVQPPALTMLPIIKY